MFLRTFARIYQSIRLHVPQCHVHNLSLHRCEDLKILRSKSWFSNRRPHFKLCVYTINITRQFRCLGIQLIVIWPHAAANRTKIMFGVPCLKIDWTHLLKQLTVNSTIDFRRICKKLRKAAISFFMSVCPSIRPSLCMDFREILYLGIVRKCVKKN